MSFEHLRTLTLNPFLTAKIIQNFLEGYGTPADIKLVFYVLPIIMSKDSRDILATKAIKSSRIETLFGTKKDEYAGTELKISRRVNISGFLERFEHLKDLTKLSLIVLCNENKITINDNITLLKSNNFNKYSGTMRSMLKAAFYLGVVLRKTNFENLDMHLGVNSLWKDT